MTSNNDSLCTVGHRAFCWWQCFIVRSHLSDDQCVEFQDDVLSAASWCDLSSLNATSFPGFSPKCLLVHQYVINKNNLSAVDRHKHLGIWIESSLRWDSRVNYIVGKENRVLGLIRRTIGSKDPVAIKAALVRPILEYASHVEPVSWTRKTNDLECHTTATCKASDDEKPCRRLLQSPERPRRLSHLSQENCTISVAAEEVEWHMLELTQQPMMSLCLELQNMFMYDQSIRQRLH